MSDELERAMAEALAAIEHKQTPPAPCNGSEACKLAGGCPECLVPGNAKE